MRRNRGAAGVDRVTLAAIEQYGVDRMLSDLGVTLRNGTYRPQSVLRRFIPKADGRQRPLGIPTIRDRVAQMAAKLVLEPIFEADFRPSSYGFRPKRSATQALETLRVHGARGGNHVLDADIRDYFGSIDQTKLMRLLEQRISDRRVLKLLRQWLAAGVMEDGQWSATLVGTPQGGVISPLLANIYLHVLDRVWEDRCAHLGTLVRYADDFVVMCDTTAAVEEARRRVSAVLTRLGLELHATKTRMVDLSRGGEGFDFLGCHLRQRMSGPVWERTRRRVYFLQRWPSQRAMRQVQTRIRDLTPRGRCHEDLRAVIADLNPVVRGWGSNFSDRERGDALHPTRPVCRGPAARASAQAARLPRSAGSGSGVASSLLRSLGTVSAPRHRPVSGGSIMLRLDRPPGSRVREIRMHGLNGGLADTRPARPAGFK